jgi:hypothetical protein
MNAQLATVVVVALLAGAAPLSAQDPRIAARLDPATAAEVGAILASARGSGLPVEPLVDRALEGASKGASGARIVAAVRSLAQDLAAARLALGAGAGEPEVTAGAGALRSGADPATLTRLRAARQGEVLTVPIGVLADLIARGVPADVATGAVLALARSRASDAEFVALRRNVERDILAGAPPGVAVAVRARGMPSTLPPTAPAATAATGDRGTTQGQPPVRRP